MEEFIRTFGTYLLIAMGVALLFVLLMAGFVARQVRHLNIPPNAGFAETLQHTPFVFVIFIDLLDFSLDFLAAPIAWILLDRWGLKALRNVSAIEALIPLTQAIPTLTIAWFAVRLFGTRVFD